VLVQFELQFGLVHVLRTDLSTVNCAMHLLAEGRFSHSIVEQSTDSTVSDICLMRSN